MDSSNTPQKPGKAIPLWVLGVALIIVALFIAFGCGFIWYWTRSDRARLDRELQAITNAQQRAEIDRQKASEKAKFALARTHQDEALVRVRQATNSLGTLLHEINATAQDASELKTNELGRTVALHPSLVAQARRLYEAELRHLPATAIVIEKLEGVRRIEQQLLNAQGTDYEPEAELLGLAQSSAVAASEALPLVAQVRNLLLSLGQEAKIKFTEATLTPNSPTLEAAIGALNKAEAALAQRTIIEKTDAAKSKAADDVATAAAEKIIAAAEVQAAKIRQDAQDAADA